MTTDPQVSEFFTAGGTLPPDAPSYVKRPTDDELFRHIMAGEFCYILTPRQMGKSSLMIRTVQRLSKAGVKSAIVDLTQIGTVQNEDQWYKGILTQIKRRLRLSVDPVSWWEQRRDIPNVQKFIGFFEDALLEIEEHVVIFIDEIDTTLQLTFRDNFFAGIRAIYNARAENPDFRRLIFVLLGVASPSDLIKDRNRTPFNIGHEVLLKPFTREDARGLERGLQQVYPQVGQKILDRIFYWTNGQPYLTQKICQNLVEDPLVEYDDGEIDKLVERLFISEQASREANLQFVRDNILSYPERRPILLLYKKLLRGARVRDNKNSLPQNHLKLSGLARVEDGIILVSNRIYSTVFDISWANKHTEIDWRSYTIGALMLVIIGFSFVFYNDGVRLPNQAATRVNGVPIYNDDRGIQYLADLFRMKPVIFPNEYEYKAKDTFFNAFSSWEEQKALIEITSEDARPSPEDYKTVVTGLYTSLADVDNSGQTTQLLEVMQASLKEMNLQNESLYQEITHWITARKKTNSDAQGALEEYGQALRRNPKNPATLFERARIYTRYGEFELALRDYDQVIAIAPDSDIEPTSIPNFGMVTQTKTTPTELVRTSTPTLGPEIQLFNTPGVTATVSILTPTASVPSTSLSPLRSIQPRFLTLGQRVAAIKNDIEQNQNLSSFLSKANPADHPNLEAKGLIPPLPPTASITSTLPAVPVIETGGPCEVATGQSIPLAVTGIPGSDVTYSWIASSGSINPPDGPTVLYTAPDTPGDVIIRVEAEKDGVISTGTIICKVFVPLSVASTTPSPTLSPTPSPTLWPCTSFRPEKVQSTDIPGEIKIDTPVQGTIDLPSGQNVQVAGTYSGIPEGHYLWVFIYSPDAGSRGRYYPQTRDAVQGWQPEPTTGQDGRWSLNVAFGAPNLCYEVIVMVADAAASQSIADQLKSWADLNNYPGYELNGRLTALPPDGPGFPQGLVEKASIEVRTR